MEARLAVRPQPQVAPLGARERVAVGIGLASLAEALAAALLAPHVPWPVRAARVAIDAVLACGFVAYLRGDRTSVAVRRPLVARVVAVALVLAGGAFALFAHGVDVWRRLFRVAVSLALAAAIALGVGRTVPA